MFKHFSDSTFKKLKKTSMNQSYCSLIKKICFSECSEVFNWQGIVQKAWRCPLQCYPLWMHWRSDLSCWGNFKEQLQFGKRRSYATYLFGWAQVKKGSRHLVFFLGFFWCFFFHLLLIIVIVQNYHFCHFWTILNKSYNWNWWKKTKAKNSSLISASL